MSRSSQVFVILIMIGACTVIGWPANGCLWSPWPNLGLWEGIQESDLIVIGEVVSIEINEVGLAVARFGDQANNLLGRLGADVTIPTNRPAAAVVLDVSATIKGPASRQVTFLLEGIESEEISGFAFPAIYFLRRDGFRWRAARYPIAFSGRRELGDLRRAIETAMALGPSAGEAAARDWHVETAALAGTRMHVVFALAGYQPLPEPALRRLAEAFARDPGSGPTLHAMLELLAPFPSAEVDRAANAAVQAMANSPWRLEALELLTARAMTLSDGP